MRCRLRPTLHTNPEILFLAGPPFGASLFDDVIKRLGRGQGRSILEFGSTWQEAGTRIAALEPAPVLVAHGLAVPAVVYAATLRRFPGIVLSNGPLARVDRVTAALRKARFALRVLLLPPVWTAWLRSSAGLRRAVVNPYVMDRDTVAALCGGLVETNAGRAQVVGWLSALESLPELSAPLAPTLVLWGEADPLYPASEASYGASRMAGSTYVAVPGGHHIHPVERPWEMADRLGAWLQDHALAG